MKLKVSIIALAFVGVTSAHAQDIEAGRKVFNKCIACHSVGPGAKNKIGPELNGLIGRKATQSRDTLTRMQTSCPA